MRLTNEKLRRVGKTYDLHQGCHKTCLLTSSKDEFSWWNHPIFKLKKVEKKRNMQLILSIWDEGKRQKIASFHPAPLSETPLGIFLTSINKRLFTAVSNNFCLHIHQTCINWSITWTQNPVICICICITLMYVLFSHTIPLNMSISKCNTNKLKFIHIVALHAHAHTLHVCYFSHQHKQKDSCSYFKFQLWNKFRISLTKIQPWVACYTRLIS